MREEHVFKAMFMTARFFVDKIYVRVAEAKCLGRGEKKEGKTAITRCIESFDFVVSTIHDKTCEVDFDTGYVHL